MSQDNDNPFDFAFHSESDNRKTFRGRGSSLELANRFEKVHLQFDPEQLEEADRLAEIDRKIETEYFFDQSGSVVSENHSPDLDFNFSLNPYRGCAHGCSYCYARPTHEYLGFNAGIDFETKIIVKRNAPELFSNWLHHPKWKARVQPILLSGVTDCYQPCEKEFELTRRCLEVALATRQPIRITTKNALVRRDVDLLAELAKQNLAFVTMSLSSLDQSLIKIMEPRSSSPRARLQAIKDLSDKGVPVKLLAAPIIPAINEQEIPKILEEAKSAGASHAGYIMLRLPLSVEPVFLDWIEQRFPDRKEKILGRVRSLGKGKLYDSSYGTRMKGQGIWAEQIRSLFETCCLKQGLLRSTPKLACNLFRNLEPGGHQQLELF